MSKNIKVQELLDAIDYYNKGVKKIDEIINDIYSI